MKQGQAKQFIDINKEAFSILAKKMGECKDLTNEQYIKYDNDSRRMALKIIHEWMTEIFGMTELEQMPTIEEESIFKRLDDNSAQVDAEFE